MRKTLALVASLIAGTQALATEDPNLAAAQQIQDILNDPQRYRQHYEAGQERVRFCGYCHGETGNSKQDYAPNLAGQNPLYLFRQFEKFRNGERQDYVMSQLAKSLTLEERINIALFFAAQDVTPRQAVDPELHEEGATLFQKVCYSCHGKQGEGVETMPRLAGQPASYVRQALNKFRTKDDSRANSPMVGIAAMLSEQDINAVSAYVQSLVH